MKMKIKKKKVDELKIFKYTAIMDISSKQLRRQKTETNLAKMDQKSCSKLKK